MTAHGNGPSPTDDDGWPLDHSKCPPHSHDRSLPDPVGDQAVADDGLLGCNSGDGPMFYCDVDGWYWHVDPMQGCFLSEGWGRTGDEVAEWEVRS